MAQVISTEVQVVFEEVDPVFGTYRDAIFWKQTVYSTLTAAQKTAAINARVAEWRKQMQALHDAPVVPDHVDI